jgi:hypothetical protein
MRPAVPVPAARRAGHARTERHVGRTAGGAMDATEAHRSGDPLVEYVVEYVVTRLA